MNLTSVTRTVVPCKGRRRRGNVNAAARTHIGLVRASNEDAVLLDQELGLFAVADGMGGHQGGETASKIGLQTLQDFVRASSLDSTITWPYGLEPGLAFEANQLSNAVRLANRRIVEEATRTPTLAGMGSTLVAVLVRARLAWIVNVGDSRLYRWRQGTLDQLTQDDSWAASMARAGAAPEVIQAHELRHALTRALGSRDGLRIDVEELRLEPGDVLLLCSDGLHGPVGPESLSKVLADAGTPSSAADRLIEAALAAGGPDNVTAVVLRIDT